MQWFTPTFLALVVAAGLTQVMVAGQTTSARVSKEDVRAAILAGVNTEYAAYPLQLSHHEEGNRATISGGVYTPTLRVAMWARRRWQERGAIPDPAEVPVSLTEAVTIIAIHKEPWCCPPLRPEPPLRVCAALVLVGPEDVAPCGDALPDSRPAAWVTSDASRLGEFDPDAIAQTAWVAAFKLTDVKAGWQFVTERHQRRESDGSVVALVGFSPIKSEDVRRWR